MFGPPRRPVAEAVRAARATFGGEPYVMFHRHNRAAMRRTISQALAEAPPDLVYLDHLDPYAFRPLFPQARILVDFHNLYGRLARRVATERAGVAGRYLAREARLLSRMETRAAAAVRLMGRSGGFRDNPKVRVPLPGLLNEAAAKKTGVTKKNGVKRRTGSGLSLSKNGVRSFIIISPPHSTCFHPTTLHSSHRKTCLQERLKIRKINQDSTFS